MGVVATVLMWFATLVALLLGILYLFFKRKYSYWERKHVPHTTPSIPFGNLGGVGIKKNIGEVFLDIYKSNSDEKYFGFWTWHRPSVMINDPELIKKVLVQDFSSFHDHGVYYNEKDDPLSAHLFSIGGAKWKNMRTKLSPTFTSGKMKLMFPIVSEIGNNLKRYLQPIAEQGISFEAKDLIAMYSTDVISSCAFGIETNSLENPKAIFREMGQKIFQPTWGVVLRNALSFFIPELAELIKITTTPKDVSKFFLGILRETVEYRETNNAKRNDFLQLLIELKNKGYIGDVQRHENSSDDPFTFEQAAGQAYKFFIGGFESSSSVLQFALWELARNLEVQQKLREEIKISLKKTEGNMTYEGIHELKYMGMVLDETLRKYPPAQILKRGCNKEYLLPGTDCIIEKGTAVYVPILGLHMNPKYFPDPDRFDPDRFTDEEKAKRQTNVYLPFGLGPRYCIGTRFAQMQMRVAMVSILSKYQVEMGNLSPRTIKLNPKGLVFMPEGGMHLYLSEISFIPLKEIYLRT